MNTGPHLDRDPAKRAVAVQLRALADAIQRTDSKPAMIAEASAAVARDLQTFARGYVPDGQR
jgi:hypothetical protein